MIYYGMPSKWADGVEKKILKAVYQQIRQLILTSAELDVRVNPEPKPPIGPDNAVTRRRTLIDSALQHTTTP